MLTWHLLSGLFFGGRPRFLLTGGSTGAGIGTTGGACSTSISLNSSSSSSTSSCSASACKDIKHAWVHLQGTDTHTYSTTSQCATAKAYYWSLLCTIYVANYEAKISHKLISYSSGSPVWGKKKVIVCNINIIRNPLECNKTQERLITAGKSMMLGLAGSFFHAGWVKI